MHYSNRFFTSVYVSLIITFIVAIIPYPINAKEGARKSKPLTPIAKIKENIVCCPGDSLLLDGWASMAPGSEIVEWGWDLDGDQQVDAIATTGELSFVAPDQACSRTIYLTVKDNLNRISAPDSAILFVSASSPRVSLPRDTTVKVGIRLSLQPTIWSSCSKAVRYEWDFNGDGQIDFSSETTPNTSRLFNRPGKFTLRLTVTDATGHKAGAQQIIRVIAAQPDPQNPQHRSYESSNL